ncbi:phospholipase B1, membrane-associated-like isoform X2 [Erinaceus europaeus]|uniref:Phospholipase B1, membrane-associated n=1 Tax=Erinaceus europaeus TaxID=9365 RepID=A0ABM3X1T0_ERIEU|nr:phospholipase B1, membrane-associated-like isoform X2 [Erinaceus europaeus]
MASTMGEINSDNRGISWSIGGDSILSTTVTLPNIFREFNSNLTGYSTATGDKDSPGARLNRAVSDAKSGDMTNQAKELIRMMQSDPTINFEQDWKLLTLFIGSNDLCHFCEDTQLYSPENFLNNIKATLDLLKEKVPRVLVNLVSPIDIVPLKEMFSNPNLTCQDDALRQVCPCLHSAAAGSQELASITEATVNYQKRIRELMASGQYESTDFTVALDPFLESFSLPRTKEGLPDVKYFAPNCFHFSRMAHVCLATGTWNMLLEPIHKRPTRYDLQESVDLKCPDEISGTLLQCRNFPSPTNPSSVHALTPADIDVVAALGDSLTAGSGIVTRPGNLSGMETQFRGLSFSGGGDGSLVNVTTLPNIIREFNKNLLGFAVNTGEASSGDAFLNQAVPRAQAKDFLNQVKTLVQKMTDDSRINLADHWKVITVLIGNSDFCDFCTDKQEYTTEKFLGHLRSGLDYLQAQVPKALVNLVDFMSPDIMRQVFIGNPDCPTENAR